MKKGMEFELEVHQLDEDDVFQSIIRLERHVIERLNLKVHGLCEVQLSETRKKVYVQARTIESKHRGTRGSDAPSKEWILMDEELRNRLGAKTGASYRFAFRYLGRYNIFNKLSYLANHEDPVVRIAFWLAIFSFFAGLLVGLLPSLFHL